MKRRLTLHGLLVSSQLASHRIVVGNLLAFHRGNDSPALLRLNEAIVLYDRGEGLAVPESLIVRFGEGGMSRKAMIQRTVAMHISSIC